MYVIDVIPLSRTAPGVLTYRSKAELPVGTIVSIMIRKTETQGIVIDSMPVADAKEMLKHARFLLSRSIPAASGMLPDAVMRAAESTALYHATSVGAALTAMFSEQVRAGVTLPADAFSNGTGFVREACELPLADRRAAYAKRIQACIAAGNAALLIVPTIPEVTYWKDALKEFHPLIITGALTGTKRAQALEKASTHFGLIIATPSFAWAPVHSLGLAILDRISAGTYTLPKRPYLSIPYAVESLMRERAIPFIVGDFPLPLEYRADPEAGISAPALSATIVDARTKKDADVLGSAPVNEGPWAALPKEVLHAIGVELDMGGRIVMLAARKGYAPAVVCRDCGQAQTDERGMPYSFSQANGERVFRTSDGTVVNAKKTCQRCGSWNLLPLGIGSERVEEELRAAFPAATIISVPPEMLTSPRKMRDVVQAFQEAGSIIIGTEAVLPWLHTSQQETARLPLGVIASADSLLSQPFWRARERFVRLAFFLQGMCRDVLLVTRHPDDAAVEAVADPSSGTFWQEESALRAAVSYPPYGTLITLSIEGSERRSSAETEALRDTLAAYDPHVLPPRQLQGALWRSTLVLTRPQGAWPDPTLSRLLRVLPPSVRVRIDPESFW
ncbi:MAG TPA: hypothetical protein VN086_02825 [Candidatus Paceibacterota bacterium]|nr:hypothetical protein [Candidatus Paceibacterota bacterium]